MDLADLADKETENFYQESAHKRRASDRLPDIGICYNCEDPVEKGKVFCNSDCTDDYRKRN